ncbi:murein hydrolase activator EnvC family protein [Bacteroidetes bacterium endosymbiont of Geopemphigus sp.]|uniref:murein hydrolase activator EnvC family protein n=1 Tax=Bacteroidetes bacterium endosymbiont of Geopemphigus sp. TaxID=2047937 RepID=UPI000CD00EE2|nr:M23 family metallopeptidase [Bacteroidetes bacterium endosymbiont of Geopemphigus sp.]
MLTISDDKFIQTSKGFIDNSGVDIRTSRSAQERVVFEGIVSAVYFTSGGGKALLTQHGNYYTVYNNLQEVYVHKGSKIKMNQSIGEVYTNSQGDTLLTFQVWYNTSKQNPPQWIKGL